MRPTTGPSYLQTVADALTRYPDREAFVAGDERLTYAKSADLISRFAHVLAAKGLRDGSSMVALSPNAPRIYLAQVACGMVRARWSGLHPLGSIEDHVALCDDAEATVLLVHPKYAETGAAIAAQASSVQTVLTLGPCDLGEDLDALAEAAPSRPLRAPRASPDEIVWMPYTGGTTGRSKGVLHDHVSMMAGMLALADAWALPDRPRYLACAPITHASGLPVAPTLARGGTVVLLPGFDPDAWLDAIEREHINYAFVVPTILYAMLDRGGLGDRDLSSLETIIYGSSPMSPSRLAEAIEAFGPVLLQGYGQTETLGLGTVLRRDEHDPVGRPELMSSCGRAVTGAQVELLDEAGGEVADGDIGEMCLRAPFTMAGYWKRPEATAEVLNGGWLRTGDLARRDDEGFFHIVDRKRDLIISGAFNVYPSEVEGVLSGLPGVSAAAVIGVPDPKWGEAVTAFVVPRPDATLDPEVLRQAVRTRKGAHQAPKVVHIVPELPTTAVGKIDKRALRAQFWTDEARAVS